MDNSTRRRLTLGFLSNWISRLAGSVVQLIQVPVFLSYWNKELYGEWMIVNAIPTYLAFSNIGFGSVATNEMTMLMGRDDKAASLRVFQSCWWLLMGICLTVVGLTGLAVWLLPVSHWMKLTELGEHDAAWIIFALSTATMFAQLEQVLGAAYTCIGRYPFGTFLKSMLSLGAYALMIIPVVMGHGARTAAIVFSVANLLGTLTIALMVKRDIPWVDFGWQYASWSEIRRLLPLAFSFMGFPVGQALNLQGTLLVIGYALGPTDVVIFGTARTVSRFALQMVQMVNQTFWPELGAAFGGGNLELVRKLHRRACQMATIIAVGITIGMMTIGPWALARWTRHQLPPSRDLLFMLMISVIFYAGWSTSSTLLQAINRHQVLAMWYLAGTAVTIVATYGAARYGGLIPAAASLILSELIMNAYVLPTSIRISEDTWGGFFAAMLEYPAALRPAALWKRISRQRQMPGDHGEMEI